MLQEWSQLHEVADYIEVLQVADLTAGQQLLGRQALERVDVLAVALVPALDKETRPKRNCVSQRAEAKEG